MKTQRVRKPNDVKVAPAVSRYIRATCALLLTIPFIHTALAEPQVDWGHLQQLLSQMSINVEGGDDTVRTGEDIIIEEGRTVKGDVVAINAKILIGDGAKIDGDAVSIGGGVQVGKDAKIDGSAVCIGQDIVLGDGAKIGKDVVAVGGRIVKGENARIGGQTSELAIDSAAGAVVNTILSLVTGAKPSQPSLPSPSTSQGIVLEATPSLGSPPTPEKKHRDQIVSVGKDVVVEADELVDGDVKVVGGNAEIKGTVTGNVQVVGGDLIVRSTGKIEGNVSCVGGKVTKEPGAVVEEKKENVPGFERVRKGKEVGPQRERDRKIERFSESLRGGKEVPWGIITLSVIFPHLFFVVCFMLLTLLCGLLLLAHVKTVAQEIRTAPLRSIGIGLLAEMLAIPVIIGFVSVVIGIPVAIVIVLALLAASVMGMASCGLLVGSWLVKRESESSRTEGVRLLVGLCVLWAMVIVGDLLVLTAYPRPNVFAVIGVCVTGFGHMLCLVAGYTGIGATLMTRFGTRPFSVAAAGRERQPQEKTETTNEHEE